MGSSIAQWLAYLLPDPAARVCITALEFFFRKNSDVAVLIDSSLVICEKLNQVDLKLPVLASGKLELQKIYI